MNVITSKFVDLKSLIEAKIQILYNHVDHTRFHMVETGCQILPANIVEPTVLTNLTQPMFSLELAGQPRSQGCIRTTLAQSNDSSILIGRQFFIPNSNELLKIVGMQTRSLQFRQLLHSKRT